MKNPSSKSPNLKNPSSKIPKSIWELADVKDGVLGGGGQTLNPFRSHDHHFEATPTFNRELGVVVVRATIRDLAVVGSGLLRWFWLDSEVVVVGFRGGGWCC